MSNQYPLGILSVDAVCKNGSFGKEKGGRIKRVLLLDRLECNYSKGLKFEEDWAPVGVEGA